MINYTLLSSAMITSAIINVNCSVGIIFLYLVILSSYTIRTYFAFNDYEDKKHTDCAERHLVILIAATYLIEVICVIILQKYDVYLISLVVLGTIIDDIVVNTKINISLPVSIAIYIISNIIFCFRFRNNNAYIVLGIILAIPVYMIIFTIFYLINYLLRQNEVIKSSLRDISIKNIEKDNLYKNLEEAYKKVESITSLRERNKIAADIHDTVGHTLTTVLVELEASKRLMNKDIKKAAEKLTLAQSQVRQGLNNIRSSVRVLEKGENILDFFNSIEALIEETERHSEVTIIKVIDKNILISEEMQKVIFSALIEGISNGIRHGKSTAFVFKLSADENKIYFSLQDNGKGAYVISPGFGLRAMKARILELNGALETSSEEGEGFNLDITFPLNKANNI